MLYLGLSNGVWGLRWTGQCLNPWMVPEWQAVCPSCIQVFPLLPAFRFHLMMARWLKSPIYLHNGIIKISFTWNRNGTWALARARQALYQRTWICWKYKMGGGQKHVASYKWCSRKFRNQSIFWKPENTDKCPWGFLAYVPSLLGKEKTKSNQGTGCDPPTVLGWRRRGCCSLQMGLRSKVRVPQNIWVVWKEQGGVLLASGYLHWWNVHSNAPVSDLVVLACVCSNS